MMDTAIATNAAICGALGLDPHDIRELTIRLSASHPPTVEIKYRHDYLLKDHAVVEVLRRFELTPTADTSD